MDELLPIGSQPVFSLKVIEKEHILKVMRACDGNKEQAYKLLEISRSKLYRKLDEYGYNGQKQSFNQYKFYP